MRKTLLIRVSAGLLAALILWLTAVTANSSDLSEAVKYVKLFHFSNVLVQWELGDYFGASGGLSFPAFLALRQSPLLLAARSEIRARTTRAAADTTKPPEEEPASSTVPTPPATEREKPDSRDNGVPAQTVIPTNPGGYTIINGVYIKNASDKILNSAVLAEGSFHAQLQEEAPQVLIVHTHGSEAYTPPDGETYVSSGNYRTPDPRYSVIGVGDEIAAALSGYGISVLHDRTLYDDPLYEGSYERSAAGIQAYLEKYPSITYVLDVHRDAVQDSAGKQYKLLSQEETPAAQISFIMGSNHDGWEENLKLAVAISARAAEKHPTIMRPITLRNSNYNQHLTSGSLLVEVGAAGNSPAEALLAGRILAQAFAEAVLNH